MIESNHPSALSVALDERVSTRQPVSFWLRDDDAVAPHPQLDHLLELTAQYAIPVTLAVIPENTSDALAQRLTETQQVSVVVHGWSHTNYASVNEKKQELGNHRPQRDILAELSRGLEHLSHLHGARFVPLLVPPWNRISPEIADQLSSLGFAGLSTFGNESRIQVKSVNSQVDIIDWRGTRGGRPWVNIESEIVAQLESGRSSIGILSHHLVHDDSAWQCLAQLFRATRDHPGASWVSVNELMNSDN